MSILDEDRSLFDDPDSRPAAYQRYMTTAKSVDSRICKVIIISCKAMETASTRRPLISIACADCIGRKYNLKHGCPVCGGSVSFIGSATCASCGTVAFSCGLSDVAAVGIVDKVFLIEDDVI